MKKIVTFFVTAFVFGISANGQGIKADILGISVGETTQMEAITIMYQKGYRPLSNRFSDAATYKNVSYGGILWNTVLLLGSSGVIGSAMLTKEQGGTEYDKLSTILTEKYEQYLVEDKENYKLFEDGKTILSISKNADGEVSMYYGRKPDAAIDTDAF